jgi:hypothetical protein
MSWVRSVTYVSGLDTKIGWRREWDSNPRYSFPHTRFPSVRLKPLGHLSGCYSLEGAGGLLQVTEAAMPNISTSN